MRRKVSEEICGGGRTYRFLERNRMGEKITVMIRKAKTDIGVGRENRPKYWLSVTVLAADRKGNIREKYNPQVKIRNNRETVDRAWILEPNTENAQRLLEQVERLAFGGQ